MPEPVELFFVRYWREPDTTGAGAWRGSVEHVGHAVKLFVADTRDVGDIIASRLAGCEPGATRRP